MKYSQYKFKFYLNANHAIYLNGVLGQNHPHTWEIRIDTVKVRSDFVQFDDIEKSIEKFLERFQDNDINKIEPFNTINPTLENISEYIKTEFEELLAKNGWLLNRIEVSETPTRSYIIDVRQEVDERVELGDLTGNSIEQQAQSKLDEILNSKTRV